MCFCSTAGKLICFEVSPLRKLRELGVRFCLIPECGGGNVGTLLQVAPVVSPTEVLDCSFEVFLETDRVNYMPTV